MATKTHYQHLLAYERWANQRLIAAIKQMEFPDERILSLVSHLLAARTVWLNRLQNSNEVMPLWQALPIEEAENLLLQVDLAWEKYLNNLKEEDLPLLVAYSNMKGELFETPVHQILTHVFNHSTYHRGQLADHLKGKIPIVPSTDFILFVRE
ncbi:MAG: DinB family protein [Spirosomataceae bacterium]